MGIRTLLLTLLALSNLPQSAISAGIDGKWKGQVQTYDGNFTYISFAFKTDGEKLTGTEGEYQISKGKIKGDKISFTLELPGADGDRRYEYIGKIKGNEIKVTRVLVFRGSFKDKRNTLFQGTPCFGGKVDLQGTIRHPGPNGTYSGSGNCSRPPEPEKIVLTKVEE
jgi:hypothetical protein